MIILPAIDIKGGQCVRLTQGDFNTVEQVAENAYDTAVSFAQEGAKWIHMVDLDGALMGMSLNAGIFMDIVRRTKLKVQIGGGIRTLEQIDNYLSGGVKRVVIGSLAISNPGFVRSALALFDEDAIAVGIDARDSYVRADGWTKDSTLHYLELAMRMRDIGVKTIIYTDISRDGTLKGPSIAGLSALKSVVPDMRIIVSGGIRNLDHIRELNKLDVYGAICGSSLYQGTLSLRDAIKITTPPKRNP